MFGIDNRLLDERFLRKLSIEGCLPAFFIYKRKVFHDERKVNWLQRRMPRSIKEKVLSIDISQEHLFRQKLLPIHKNLLSLPMTALIHPENGKSLNERLIRCRRATIEDYEKVLSNFQRHKTEDVIFIPLDIKKLRRSIIFLNWFIQQSPTERFSVRAMPEEVIKEISVEDNIEDLKIKLVEKAFRNKREIKKILSKVPSDISKLEFLSYFESISLKLSSFWKTLHAVHKEALFDAYAQFIFSNPRVSDYNYPSYYLYSKGFKNMDKLKELNLIGVKRMKDFGFLSLKLESNTRNKEESILRNSIKLISKSFNPD